MPKGRAKRRRGEIPGQAKPEMPFGEWIDMWYQNYNKGTIRERTQGCYENRIYNHIIPEIGNIPLNSLTQNDLQEFYTRLKVVGRLQFIEQQGKGLSDRMIRSCHASCRMALEKAVTEGLIPANPAIGCKLPPKKAREMQVLTHEEMQRFLIQAKYDGYYEIFMLDLATGLRSSELMGLKWSDLNTDTGELHIERQVYYEKSRLKVTTPKTKASVRTIILPPLVVKTLVESGRRFLKVRCGYFLLLREKGCRETLAQFIKRCSLFSTARNASGYGFTIFGTRSLRWLSSMEWTSRHCRPLSDVIQRKRL